MRRIPWSLASQAGRAGLVASAVFAFGLAAQPAAAQPTFGCSTPADDTIQLIVGNPSAGDTVPQGNMVIHGIAYDRSSTSGAGIDRVALFLESRDTGGQHLADATLGMANPYAAAGSEQTHAAWAATIGVPNAPGQRNLVVHAHSAVSDHESVVTVPLVISQDSMPGLSCSSTTTANVSTAADSIHLELSNPGADSSVKVGAFVIQGIAFDNDATAGTGIDRVSLFLDNRDLGGMFLGNAELLDTNTGTKFGQFTATVNIPDLIANHTLFAYAHSSVTGHDTWVSVPISIVR